MNGGPSCDPFAEELAKSFIGSYDVATSATNPIVSADYRCRGESYFISPRFNVWSAEDKECIRVYRLDNPSIDTVKDILDESWDSSLSVIRPSKEHRSSVVFTVMVCDGFDDSVRRFISRYVRRKSFRFMLHGTVVQYAIAMDSHTYETVSGRGAERLAESVRDTYKRCCE